MPVSVPPDPCSNCYRVLRNGYHSFKCGMDGSLIEYDWDENLKTHKAYKKRLPLSASESLYECPYGVPFKSTEKESSMKKKSSIIKRFRQSVFRLVSGKHKEKGLPSPSIPQTIRKQQSTTILSSNKGRALSEQDIKYLIEKAESHIDSNELQQALNYYNQVIESRSSHAHYFKRRALTHRMMGEFNSAISDMDKAIELDPDDHVSYWERGACYAHKLSLLKDISKDEKTNLLKKILKNYKASVERDPTSAEAWLAILETDMLLQNWDDAISNYGSCKPYIDTKQYQLVRSWLGCLSLIFADESIEDEDMKSLNDSTIRLNRTSWCVSEIDSLFIELENEKFSKEKLKIAEEIHKMFIDHFDEPPMRFNNH